MVKVARPWVAERTDVAYPNISDSGTLAVMTSTPPGRGSVPAIRPRRRLRSPTTVPTNSVGATTSTAIIGSSSVGLARRAASLNAIEPAILKAISDESTSWYEPSTSRTLMSTIGYPATTPPSSASRMP